jgi:hypothetical protein
MEAVAEQELSVVLSSHLVADLERSCDYVIVLVASRVQVAGEVEALLAAHHLLAGPRRDPAKLPADWHVVSVSHTDRQTTLLVRTDGPIHDPAWTVGQVGLEDLVLAYMSQAVGAGGNHRPALDHDDLADLAPVPPAGDRGNRHPGGIRDHPARHAAVDPAAPAATRPHGRGTRLCLPGNAGRGP